MLFSGSLYISPQILAPRSNGQAPFHPTTEDRAEDIYEPFLVWILSTSDPTVQGWRMPKDAPSYGPPHSKEINDDSPRADGMPHDVR